MDTRSPCADVLISGLVESQPFIMSLVHELIVFACVTPRLVCYTLLFLCSIVKSYGVFL